MNIASKRKFSYGSVLFLLFSLLGCQAKEKTNNASTDMSAFNSLVTLDIPLKSVSWEVFGTPEYSGGVPGPTDYLTLIAQLENSKDGKFDQRPHTGLIWIAPEAARRWLDSDFRNFLEKSKDGKVDVSTMEN